MAFALRKRGPSTFERAADGSMTLMEHIRELRNRLFRASLAILVGFGFGIWLATPVRLLLSKPYCDLPQAIDPKTGKCLFVQLGVADVFLLNLKIGLWVGLIIAAPIWLYQLWAFIAPGLHRHERRYAYVFTALAAPLFAAGAVLAFFVTTKGLEFLLNVSGDDISTTLEVTRYISFVTNLVLLFGVAFEFPLIVLMLNFVGLASAKRLLSWWRVAIFVFFAFSAVVTPTPDPFGMTALALCLSALYFAAVGVAFLNDRRRGRGQEVYAGIADDEVSPLDLSSEPVPTGARIEASAPVEAPEPVAAPAPIERRYDDMT
ncbi:sec-independent protein translocase protein TatC [Micromonospora sediminicola]|uniref:Sec-independent protein translocase protein TatC n=1 Tax=Micromonospora sediminicola TaxID=946078 RepID=A0A1A9BCS1_9ACTN|nr:MULTISPECIES: twin-arginine translocase subunit TatC [Micromonospora]PGH45099.1 twin-arginine translocase subunit TatC [Micromonospora sp. WMMA1996]SBT66948.1 sec-independent protein translocase protein TatC [Micromonospora sediminicola]